MSTHPLVVWSAGTRPVRRALALALLMCSSGVAADSTGLSVTRHELANGMRFLIVPFGDAPVVATLLLVQVGGVDDPKGQTGVAHLLEHMMFKGTTTIGTTDFEVERPHLERLQAASRDLDRARRDGAAPEAIARLEADVEAAHAAHEPFVVKNEIWQIYQRCGGTGLNATTANDFTQYFVTLPSNQLEVWARVESDRLANPVFREFYSERDVVHEERRLRTDSTTRGQFDELFDLHAFLVHPYRQPVVGFPEDIDNTDHDEVLSYFRAFYAPNNCIVALVGDVDPPKVIDLVERRFGGIPAQSLPRRTITPEPEVAAVRRMEAMTDGGSQLTIAWRVPAYGHADSAALEVASRVLSGGGGGRGFGRFGRGGGTPGRLRARVIDEQKLASRCSASVGFGRYPGLFRVVASPRRDVSFDDLENAVLAEMKRLGEEPPTEEELTRIRTAAAAQAVRGLTSPMGIARALTRAEALAGDWHAIDRDREALLAVTAEDVARVAREYFTDAGRVVAIQRAERSEEDEDDPRPDEAPDGTEDK